MLIDSKDKRIEPKCNNLAKNCNFVGPKVESLKNIFKPGFVEPKDQVKKID